MTVILLEAVVLLTGCPKPPQAPSDETVLLSFDKPKFPAKMAQNNAQAKVVHHGKERGLQVNYHVAEWPNVSFTPVTGVWDWSNYAALAVDLYNPGAKSVAVCVRADNEGASGVAHCNTGNAVVGPGERTRLSVRFNTGASEKFWGMRGLPGRGPLGEGPALDSAHIVAFQVFLAQPSQPETLILEQAVLLGKGVKQMVTLPFVNRYGQYVHEDWPGKLKSDIEFQTRRVAEKKAIAAAPVLPGRDAYGGYMYGPRLKATGWFRTEKVDGKWWLVTPNGHVFFSLGMDCVGTGERTFITGRDGWFESLPNAADEHYKPLFTEVNGAHSMAERIGGKGTAFSFYTLNLMRKYGDSWADKWRQRMYPRLRSWGFNTIANWSREDVLERSPMPFVGTLAISGTVREVMGASGYWGRMRDVFDESFAKAAEASLAGGAQKYAKNPLCIGFFVDNEMSWETVRGGTLASPPDQPCRVALVAQLTKKYATIDKLNQAWGTKAADWNALRLPEKANDACTADLDEFVYQFAKKYFETVNGILKKNAPNQLYLGCRFSSAPPRVVRACADVADVVSFNLYQTRIDASKWTGDHDLGKPLIIGEFHFGATDRGMFHPGIVPTKDQEDRAAHYIKYVESVADCPAFVGCHWFQCVDEPITGRWFDGENYNIGFLDVTDTPYPELVEAAKQVHAEIYKRRCGEEEGGKP